MFVCRPNNCPDSINELMRWCWAHNPDDRPTFLDICHRILQMQFTVSQRFQDDSFTTSEEGRAKYAAQLRGEASDDDDDETGADVTGNSDGNAQTAAVPLNMTANNRDESESDVLLVKPTNGSNSNGGTRTTRMDVNGGPLASVTSHLANPEIPLSELVVKFGERGNSDAGIKDPDSGVGFPRPTNSIARLGRIINSRARRIFFEGSRPSSSSNTATSPPNSHANNANSGNNSSGGNNPFTPA